MTESAQGSVSVDAHALRSNARIITASFEDHQQLHDQLRLHQPEKEEKALPETLRPTKEQKTKSSLVALAFDAKLNEDDLEEKWAEGRRRRQEAKSKYGTFVKFKKITQFRILNRKHHLVHLFI